MSKWFEMLLVGIRINNECDSRVNASTHYVVVLAFPFGRIAESSAEMEAMSRVQAMALFRLKKSPRKPILTCPMIAPMKITFYGIGNCSDIKLITREVCDQR